MEKAGSLMNLYNSSTGYAGLLLKTGKHKYYRISTDLLAAALQGSVVLLFAACCLLFLSLGLAFWLSEVTGSLKIAFFIMGGIYLLLIGVVIVLAKSSLQVTVKNTILRRITEYTGDYSQLREQEKELEKELEAGEAKLRRDYETVKEEFSGMTGSPQDAGSDEQDSAGGKIRLPVKLIGQAAEFLIGNFLLKGAGPIKRMVFPVIAKAIINSRFSREKKNTGLFANLRNRLSKFL